mmetsp:Transcript_49981/g.140074  ORF Transcript_49981/g.140074 Transcript_49981/m.140074 type:complete len:304 (+) Transcript_49981:1577-2488(+)
MPRLLPSALPSSGAAAKFFAAGGCWSGLCFDASALHESGVAFSTLSTASFIRSSKLGAPAGAGGFNVEAGTGADVAGGGASPAGLPGGGALSPTLSSHGMAESHMVQRTSMALFIVAQALQRHAAPSLSAGFTIGLSNTASVIVGAIIAAEETSGTGLSSTVTSLLSCFAEGLAMLTGACKGVTPASRAPIPPIMVASIATGASVTDFMSSEGIGAGDVDAGTCFEGDRENPDDPVTRVDASEGVCVLLEPLRAWAAVSLNLPLTALPKSSSTADSESVSAAEFAPPSSWIPLAASSPTLGGR